MLATLYTAVPLPSVGMRSGLHKQDPQSVLAKNLAATFEKRGLSARKVAQEIRKTRGLKISNKTVSNMVNGDGNPQLEGLIAVAKYIRVPLWQLLCPGTQISQADDEAIASLLETFVALSEVGRRIALKNIKGQALLEHAEKEAGSLPMPGETGA